jgi:hypothetical protein
VGTERDCEVTQEIYSLNKDFAKLVELETVDFSKIQCGLKTLQGYVTAICDLYDFENNPHSHPRIKAVRNLIDSVKKTGNKRKDESFCDRLKDTALDTITFSEYMKNATYLGLDSAKSESNRIALRLDVLMMFSCMACSQITRGLRISEVGVEMEIQCEEDEYHRAIRVTINNGKTNQFERHPI